MTGLPAPAPYDWLAANEPAYTDLNSNIVNSVQYLLAPPSVKLSGAALGSWTAGTWYTPTWTASADNYSGFSVANNWWVAPIAGWYSVDAYLALTGATATAVYAGGVFYTQNGVLQPPISYSNTTPGNTTTTQFSVIQDIYLLAGDYVSPYWISTTGAGTFSSAIANICWWGI